MGGHGDWRGSGMGGSGILGRLGHADRRALIDLESLYYFRHLPQPPHWSEQRKASFIFNGIDKQSRAERGWYLMSLEIWAEAGHIAIYMF
jgi:hypothetical protein